MLKHFQPSATARVLVTGGVILDRYVHGVTDRVSPEAPVPIVRVHHTEERPGGAANMAVNIRSLGVPVSLLGITGHDESAALLDTQLSAFDKDDPVFRDIHTLYYQGACSVTTEWDGRYMMDNNYRYSKQLLEYCGRHEFRGLEEGVRQYLDWLNA